MLNPFTAQEFLVSTPNERIRRCKAMAAEAAKISAASDSRPLRKAYRDLAKQLCTVADEVARESVVCEAMSREIQQDFH